MIDRLAEIALGVGERLAGLAHHQRHERRAVGLEQICGAVEQACARLAAEAIPSIAGPLGRVERAVDAPRDSPCGTCRRPRGGHVER